MKTTTTANNKRNDLTSRSNYINYIYSDNLSFSSSFVESGNLTLRPKK